MARRSLRVARRASSGSPSASFSANCIASMLEGSVRRSGAVALRPSTSARTSGGISAAGHASLGNCCSARIAAAWTSGSERSSTSLAIA